MAFAKGQLIHNQSNLFDPENAKIFSNEKLAVISLKLGVHSARIQFSLAPVPEGGRVVVNYTDSGASYAPGSDIRIKALAEAFRQVGFHVKYNGYVMDATFDKDSGAATISQLPEKLTFAIQCLTSTRDLDMKIIIFI
jgi:hypothetical protein